MSRSWQKGGFEEKHVGTADGDGQGKPSENSRGSLSRSSNDKFAQGRGCWLLHSERSMMFHAQFHIFLAIALFFEI